MADNATADIPEGKKDASAHLRTFAARDLPTMKNSEALLEAHKKATGGKIMTRFPPEPNGYLHVGHAKSMFLNFGYAKETGGLCYMRFDDTNPEAEKQEYIDAIHEDMQWLGHKPWKTTYSSDYFPQLYDYAIVLIKKGLAYVDHQTKDDIAKTRAVKGDSPWRTRTIEENLKLFEDMRKGKYGEGMATLRLKIDNQNPNPTLWDPVAYRIKHIPHPRTADAWCIYPSYDYSHCIIDSIENITHSLCTTEFEIRRDLYYWVLWALDLYRPFVWEFSRLNITGTALSKRKLLLMVKEKFVRGWDDPRMPTVRGMRRRGFTPASLHKFCELAGVSRNDNVLDVKLLEHCVRLDLDLVAARALAVLNPLKVTIKNFEARKVTLPNHPKDTAFGSRDVWLCPTLYIEHDDFKLEDAKGYFGLAPGKQVLLRNAGIAIQCDEVVKDAQGNPVELKVTALDVDKLEKKPKGVLHWVSLTAPGGSVVKAEMRLYDRLFKSDFPAELENWIEDLNPTSEVIVRDALIEPSLVGVKAGTPFQFERLGYFTVDSDSRDGHLVFNRTITLKESKEKNDLKGEAPKQNERKPKDKKDGSKKEGEGNKEEAKNKKEKKEKKPAAAPAPAQ
eukprot:TRINITY_DN1440_c0_g1::TRINITY_DN1440_c0_g1_i1::g.27099::m.27099 TRINITY_DN1440_c0_g1::TRINITY_DN1440_c0_g1_i1::g.27099  ORF type:complete len:656 (-),score=281.09,sp/P52780/SYQ_LUPLU/55.10/0.0,tRNA-synt_1c/PF00749.16/4.2e-108,tRNA-synt_1c/PF00749.16/1.5e+04,tRNA-synt_1c_C/PF03950.13/1e-43,tRNA-synt_1e/PF01406.14/0.1 TRINITY_DN1440_c0_g1_i1:97-1947(-)